MKFRIIRFSSLGDCILLCPFLAHLKAQCADEVSVVTSTDYVELFASASGVDSLIALDRRSGWRGVRQLVGSHRHDGYAVIDAHNTMRSRLVARGLGGADATIRKYYRRRAGLILFKRRRETPTMSERYEELGRRFGLPAMAETTGGIKVPAAAVARMSRHRLPTKRVVVAPGSRWPMKRWGTDKFAALAQYIAREHDCHVVLVGDARDAPPAERIAASLAGQVTNLVGNTSVMEAAAVIQGAVTFIGNDSGLMHLAEAVGVPVIALFGPTVEAFGYYPTLPASRVVERDIACRPCSRNGSRKCPKGTQECLAAIPAEAVAEAFTDLVEGRNEQRYAVP
ncbi:MAG: glycosyltransferase family 9 protein [Candidatus Krumholzibacteriia bacterium]